MAQRVPPKPRIMRMNAQGDVFRTRRLCSGPVTNEDRFEGRFIKDNFDLVKRHWGFLREDKVNYCYLLGTAYLPVKAKDSKDEDREDKDNMASSDVDMKFLGRFAANIADDHPFLSSRLFQVSGNLVMLSPKVIRARQLRRLDTTRDTKSVELYCRIIWYAREGLEILEHYVLPLVEKYGELKVLCYKLRATYYHLFVLFHNQPPITIRSGNQVQTPPGLKSPHRQDKGKAPEHSDNSPDTLRPSSVQPTHQLEGGPVGGGNVSVDFAPNFLVPAADYRPIALNCFREATALAERLLWGSHPLRLSVKVEFTAFLYDCLHDRENSRQMAKMTIAEVYNAQEGMDDDMFEDAAELVGILGRMMKRGTSSGTTGGGHSTPGAGVGTGTSTPGIIPTQTAVATPGMENPI